MRRTRIAAVVLAGAALAAGAPAALAHVDVTSSSPSAGATVKALPKTVRVTFEDIIVKLGRVTLVGRDGKNHAASAKIDPAKRARVLVTTKGSVAGRWTLTMTVTSADGHTVKRTIFFRTKA